MAVNQVFRSSPIRLMGMSSGMDTEGIIQASMRMHQFKIGNQMRNRTMIQWRQDIHNDIKSQITSLRQTYLSNLGSKSMMSRSAFMSNVATVSGVNSGAVTATARQTSTLGNLTINSISQLATTASVASSGPVAGGFASALASSNFAYGDTKTVELWPGGAPMTISRSGDGKSIGFNVDGWNHEVDATHTVTNSDGHSVKFTKNGDGSITYEAFYTDEGTVMPLDKGRLSFVKNSDGIYTGIDYAPWVKDVDDPDTGEFESMGQIGFAPGKAENAITINGKSFTVFENDTIDSLLSRINSDSSLGATLRYDKLSDRFLLESKNTGASAQVTFDAAAAGLFKFTATAPNDDGYSVYNGKSAEAVINGIAITSETNTFDSWGVQLTLHGTSNEAIVVNVKRDTDRAFNAIKDFIDTYNSLISKLEGLLNDRKTSREAGYKPLTDEEKAAMTEKQIEEWEAIAKKGIMRSDRGIQNLVSSLRASFFEQIEGTGISPSQIGLTTGNYFDGTGGQIIINEERLRAALEANPDQVADIFIKIDSTPQGPRGVGLLHKLDGLMRDFVNTTQTNSLEAIEKSLKEANERIARMEERMWADEDKLYRQFAAMETALSKMQQQGDWFNQMLGK